MPTAVITGASRGIGRAIAERLAERYHIVAVARTASDLETLARDIAGRGGSCQPVVLDITDHAAVAAALRGVEAAVLVNNAGIGIIRPLTELSVEDWRRQVATNFDALFYVTRVLLPGMIARGTGHIVNIASLAGRSSFVGGTCYSATKHAVIGFSESLMLEVRDAGVRVSVVLPGSVDTAFSPRTADASWKLTAADVAGAVWYLLTQPDKVLVSRIEMRAGKIGRPDSGGRIQGKSGGA